MDQWDVIGHKVQQLEGQLYQLEEDYQRDRGSIEEEMAVYQDRYRWFQTLVETKYEAALGDFRQREVSDYHELTAMADAYLLDGDQQLQAVLRDCEERLDQLEASYRKAYDSAEEQLQAAYAQRRQLDVK